MREPDPNGRVTYDYECQSCGTEREIVVTRKLADRQDCPECGARLTKLVTGCQFLRFTPYWDDVMDNEPVRITSMRQRSRLLKERGLVDADNGENPGRIGESAKQQAKRYRKEREHQKKLEAKYGI